MEDQLLSYLRSLVALGCKIYVPDWAPGKGKFEIEEFLKRLCSCPGAVMKIYVPSNVEWKDVPQCDILKKELIVISTITPPSQWLHVDKEFRCIERRPIFTLKSLLSEKAGSKGTKIVARTEGNTPIFIVTLNDEIKEDDVLEFLKYNHHEYHSKRDDSTYEYKNLSSGDPIFVKFVKENPSKSSAICEFLVKLSDAGCKMVWSNMPSEKKTNAGDVIRALPDNVDIYSPSDKNEECIEVISGVLHSKSISHTSSPFSLSLLSPCGSTVSIRFNIFHLKNFTIQTWMTFKHEIPDGCFAIRCEKEKEVIYFW